MSNKTLALLIVAAIAVSLGGTVLSLQRLQLLENVTGMVVVEQRDARAPLDAIMPVAEDAPALLIDKDEPIVNATMLPQQT